MDGSGNFFVAENVLNSIAEFNSSGALVNASLIPGLLQVQGVQYYGGHLFVRAGGTIGEYNTDGSAVNATLITGAVGAFQIGFDSSGQIYVPHQSLGTIAVYSSSGTLLTSSLVSGLSYPEAVNISPDGYLYVAEGNLGASRISEFTLSGQDVNRSLITGLHVPEGLIVIPEPCSMLLLVIGLSTLLALHCRRR